jgi:hypothetical protein
VPYVANANDLRPGAIVKIEKPPASSGKPTYPHFFVVLDVPEHPKAGDIIPLVGVSSRIDPGAAKPEIHVPMKWAGRKGGDPETGFDRPCHACADFTHELPIYAGRQFGLEVAAEHKGKWIRTTQLALLVATMNAWARKH